MEELKETDVAWAAGFFDGEGCIFIHRLPRKKNIYYHLSISMANTDFESVKKFKKIFNRGSLTHYKFKNKKDQLVYSAQNKDAYYILKNIYKFSCNKKAQIELALEFQECTINNGHEQTSEYHEKRKQYFLKMKELKK